MVRNASLYVYMYHDNFTLVQCVFKSILQKPFTKRYNDSNNKHIRQVNVNDQLKARAAAVEELISLHLEFLLPCKDEM